MRNRFHHQGEKNTLTHTQQDPGWEGSRDSGCSMANGVWTHPTALSLVAGPVEEEDTMFEKWVRELVKYFKTPTTLSWQTMTQAPDIFLLTLQKTRSLSFKDWKPPQAGCRRRHLSLERAEAHTEQLGPGQHLRAARANESGNGERRAIFQPLPPCTWTSSGASHLLSPPVFSNSHRLVYVPTLD